MCSRAKFNYHDKADRAMVLRIIGSFLVAEVDFFVIFKAIRENLVFSLSKTMNSLGPTCRELGNLQGNFN